MTTMKDFAGSTALVTGGASGIGLACAELLRDRGARVVLADLNSAGAADAARRLGVDSIAFDVADRHAVTAAHEALRGRGLQIDRLVNCAGIVQSPEPPDVLAHAQFQRVMAIDFEGTYACCAEFGSAMAARGHGGDRQHRLRGRHALDAAARVFAGQGGGYLAG